MTSEEQKRLDKIFVDPKMQAAVVDVVVHNRPPGWSRRSHSPYYKRRYAEVLMKEVDKMIEDRTDRCYHYSDFEPLGISRNSLYLRLNQSKRYLLDCMDTPDRKYKRFFETVEIFRNRNVGVEIRFIEEFRSGDSLIVPRQVVPKAEQPRWKTKVDEFLEDSEAGDKLLIEKLALTPEEIGQLKTELAGLKNVMSNITSHSIKLVKINVRVSR